MATSTKTRRQPAETQKQAARGRKRQVQTRSADGSGARRTRSGGNGETYMRSAERLAGQMKSALAEWTAMAGDSLPDAATIARGRRSVRHFVQDNAVVLGIAGAGLGVLVGAAIAGGLRESSFEQDHDDITPDTFL
jgi:hypothetical protein